MFALAFPTRFCYRLFVAGVPSHGKGAHGFQGSREHRPSPGRFRRIFGFDPSPCFDPDSSGRTASLGSFHDGHCLPRDRFPSPCTADAGDTEVVSMKVSRGKKALPWLGAAVWAALLTVPGNASA